MENWLQDSGRPALFDALGEAWSRLDNDYRSACHAENIRVAGLDGEIKVLRARVAQVEWLEQQNKILREELEQQRSKQVQQRQHGDHHDLPTSHSEPRTPLAPQSVNKLRNLGSSTKHVSHPNVSRLGHDELVAEYGKLEEKYNKLRGQVSIGLEANETLQKQSREKNQACEKWVQYAKTVEAQSSARKQKIEKLKARLASMAPIDAPADASFTSETHSVADVEHDQAESGQTVAPTFWPAGITRNISREPSVPGGTGASERSPSLPPLPVVANIDAAAPSDQNTIKEPSSDTPIVVSERSVRKRRREDQPSAQTPATTRIKLEEGSDPVMTSEQRRFMAHDSIDFDNADDRVTTPRKSRHHRSPSPASSPAATRAGFTSAYAPQREEAASVDELIEDHHEPRPIDRSSALIPYSHNGLQPAVRKPKRKSILGPTLRHGIASLAEDGESTEAVASHTFSGQEPRAGRLAGLLNNPAPPEREAINLPSGTLSRDTATSLGFDLSMPPRRQLPWERPESTTSKYTKTPEVPKANNKRATPASKVTKAHSAALGKTPSRKEAPLRQRPLESLHRADFKLNPEHNGGYDFAFTEVVRGKDRALLPGCSKEECCGKLYRPLAEGELANTADSAVRNALEQHLGDGAWKLASMSKAEKEKMWVDARIKEMSQKFGRHRERHGTMREPPGWDRLGFPSTQEDEEDRQEAKRLELEEVKLRHSEALKKGKYLFRDEEP
ncbi:hypothetical protein LQW54_002183 [Pestalotiopsis sp. IQ-011]